MHFTSITASSRSFRETTGLDFRITSVFHFQMTEKIRVDPRSSSSSMERGEKLVSWPGFPILIVGASVVSAPWDHRGHRGVRLVLSLERSPDSDLLVAAFCDF